MAILSSGPITLEQVKDILHPRIPYRPVPKDYDNPKNLNPELCAECGGECCKTCGCHFSPDDFPKLTWESLEEEFWKGMITIEYVDGEQVYESFGAYIVRMRNVDGPAIEGGYFRSQRAAPCIMWTEKGCRLPYEKRPTGGRLLVPSRTEGGFYTCRNSYNLSDCWHEWKAFDRLLSDFVEAHRGAEVPFPEL